MTRKSRRSVERALSDLHETDDGPAFDEVRIITETDAGDLVDLETGDPMEPGRGEVIATIGAPPSET
jgi:hypothetical protein